MTALLVGLVDVFGTFGWVGVWLLTLVAGIVCIFRGRSGAGACLGGGAIVGLALQICAGSLTSTIATVLDFLPLQLGWGVAAFVRSLGTTVVFGLVVAATLLQRPPKR